MRLERRKNTKRGIVYGIINKIVTLLLPFVVRTIMLRTIGIEYVGVKGLFSSILTVLSLAELGIGSAIVYSMYKPIAEDDVDTICALLKLYKKLYRFIGGIILLLGLIITPFVTYLIHGDYPQDINLQLIFILYVLDAVVSYWMYAYKSSLLNAYQRTDIISKAGTISQALMSFSQIIFLIYTKNFLIYVILSIIFTIINNLIISVNVDRMYPELQCRGNVEKLLLDNIRIKVAGVLIGKVCDATRNTFDNIFMSIFLGLTQAAIYSNYFYVFSALSGFTGIILTSIQAGIGNSIAIFNKDKNYSEMLKLDYIYMTISGWMSISMLCLYQPFMSLWAGNELIFSEYTMMLFPIYFYTRRMGDIRNIYSDAAGLFWENRHRTILEMFANIILNYAFVKCWGAFGIMLATILTIVFIGYIGGTIILFKHYFKSGLRDYIMNQMLYGVIFVIIGGATYRLCQFLGSDMSWLTLFERMIICFTVVPVCYLALLHRTKKYKEAKKWILSIIVH